MQRPEGMQGMWHIALQVRALEACERFYVDILGMRLEWKPDADNVYLTGGRDNLALHRLAPGESATGVQRLDHIGFILQQPERVDEWFAYLQSHGVEMIKAPKTHRDGARSFYCRDPDGNALQFIYHPPLAPR